MNKQLTKAMRVAHEKQAKKIRRSRRYDDVKREFEIEYQVAREMAKARSGAGMTQVELAEIMGTTQSVISRIERGANVSVETLERYVTACGHRLQIRII